MSNTTWVTTRKNLTVDRVVSDLEDIIHSKGLDHLWGVAHSGYEITIFFNSSQPTDDFSFWLVNKNRIEFSHGQCRGAHCEYLSWVLSFIQNELSLKYNGWIRDEGLGPREVIEAVPNKYNTYQSYFEKKLDHVSKGTARYESLVNFFKEMEIR